METVLNEYREQQTQSRPLTNPWTTAQPLTGSSGRPRVLHLVNSFEAGGTERQFIELLKRLNRERYDVRLSAIHDIGCFRQEIAPFFPTIPEFPLTSFYNPNAYKQLRKLQAFIQREGIDILHAHGFYDSLFGSVAGRLSGIKVIASQRHLKLSDRRVHDWGTQAIHRLADRIVVNSQAIRESILARNSSLADKVIVIRNGLCEPFDPFLEKETLSFSDARFDNQTNEPRQLAARQRLCSELGLNASVKLLGMVARLVAFKGHRYFLEAAAQVAKEIDQAHFVLIGEGTERGAIERQADRLGIRERVHLMGNRKDSRHLVSAFDVAVLPSLSEGLPNSVMEAMSAGVPVVATPAGGTTELIRDGETGYLVPPADAKTLAQRLLFVLTHESESQAVAESGQKFIHAQFGIRRTVEAVENLYQELLTAAVADN
jgi:glycosyltransferase involved in cell wall biosynthesis